MFNFTISFSYRGNSHVASVYYDFKEASYAVYFTDVELILEFGSKVQYSKEGQLTMLKQNEEKHVSLLRDALKTQLEAAA